MKCEGTNPNPGAKAPSGASGIADQPKPIWEMIACLVAEVPEEELAKLPRDGSERVDELIG